MRPPTPPPPAGKEQEPAGRLPSGKDRPVKAGPAPGRVGGGVPPGTESLCDPPIPLPPTVKGMAADPRNLPSGNGLLWIGYTSKRHAGGRRGIGCHPLPPAPLPAPGTGNMDLEKVLPFFPLPLPMQHTFYASAEAQGRKQWSGLFGNIRKKRVVFRRLYQ
jgi:hypothetical protein